MTYKQEWNTGLDLKIDDEKNKKMTENDILELVKKRQSIN